MNRESGQLASAPPSAAVATGMPDHVLVPVMLAAMMAPTASDIEWPVLPQTCAANSVAMSLRRLAVSGRAVILPAPCLGELLPERHAEAAALRAAEIRLAFRALLLRDRLRVREPDAPAVVLDGEHQDLELRAEREGLAKVAAARRGELRRGHEPGLTGAEPDEHAERLHALHGTGDHRTDGDPRFDLGAGQRVVGRQRECDAPLLQVDADHHHGDLGAGRGRFAQLALAMTRDLADVQEAVDTRKQFDEEPELRHARGPPPHHLPLAERARDGGPRIPLERLEAERDLALVFVDAQHLHRHGVSDAEAIGRPADPR